MAFLQDAFTSDIAIFIVGEHESEFRLHMKALMGLSNYFQGLFRPTSDFAEATEKAVKLPQISADDFKRFCCFVYTGDYVAPSYITEESNVEKPDTEPDSTTKPMAHKNPSSKSKRVGGVSNPTDVLRQIYEAKRYMSISPGLRYLQGCKPTPHENENQNCSECFLAHARLYAFAKEKMIHSLENLALQKLHDTLLGLKLSERRYEDVLSLARFAYEEDYAELQDLIVIYHGSQYKTIGGWDSFSTFAQEQSTFSASLLRVIYQTFPKEDEWMY